MFLLAVSLMLILYITSSEGVLLGVFGKAPSLNHDTLIPLSHHKGPSRSDQLSQTEVDPPLLPIYLVDWTDSASKYRVHFVELQLQYSHCRW